ncbi:DUF2939 domain-containing protein [Enterovirga sp. CN4-39]|uniref:DUF2939 domain-containing protein n=1 Tax=Enterovirga sp. CN4-39 TaxID=3400910 RepID=UPI003C01FC1A
MRWFVGSAIGLVLLWAAYVASPYWALVGLARAIDARDVQAISERVNFRAFRLSLTRQVAAAGMGSRSGSADANIAASTLALAAEPLLERIVTPEGVIRLLDEIGASGRPGPESSARGIRLDRGALQTVIDLVRASRWRGFRNVYFSLASKADPNQQSRLQLRFSRLRWRLVAVDLSPEARQRLRDEAVRLYEERSRR